MAELILTARRWKEKGAYAALRTWKNFVFKIKQNGKKSDNNLTLYSDRLTKQKVSSKHICSGERKFAIKYRGKKQRNMFNQRTVGQVSLCNPEALSWVQLKETSSCLVESKTVKLSSPTHTHTYDNQTGTHKRFPSRGCCATHCGQNSCLLPELLSVLSVWKYLRKGEEACDCLLASNWCSSCCQTPSRGQTAES